MLYPDSFIPMPNLMVDGLSLADHPVFDRFEGGGRLEGQALPAEWALNSSARNRVS